MTDARPSVFARLPASWLSHCFSFLDLRALLHAGSVSRHWCEAQKGAASWTTNDDDWDSSRCWRPTTIEEIARAPRIFQTRLANLMVDIDLLAVEPDEEEAADGETPLLPLPTNLFRNIFDTFTSLSSLSVHDVNQQVDADEMAHLLQCSARRLRAFSMNRELGQKHLLDLLLQPPAEDGQTRMRRLHLLYETVPRSCFARVIESLASMSLHPHAEPTYSWPLQRTLTALTLTIADTTALLPLTHIPLRELELTVEGNLAPFDGRDFTHWESIYKRRFTNEHNASSNGGDTPSAWCLSLRTCHLTVSGLHDGVLRALSHLTSLTDLAILNTPADEEEPLLHILADVHRHDWHEVLSDITGRATHALTPMGVYELRHLRGLVRLELELRQGWILPLVPFLSLDAVNDARPDGTLASSVSPIAFWSSFPELFCFKYHSPFRCDWPCLRSLGQLDANSWSAALDSLLPSQTSVLHQQDLLLYALAACEPLRSLHIRTTFCSHSAMNAFVRRDVLKQITLPPTDAVVPLGDALDVKPVLSVKSQSLLPMFDLCFFSLPRSILTDEFALSVASFSASLQYLHFIHCETLGDAGLRHILHACINLHTLDVHGCESLTSASLVEIGSCIPLLHSLNLSKISHATDDVLTRIITRTPDLHSLHLERTPTTSAVLLPIIISHVRLLCLNVRMTEDRWSRDELDAYQSQRECPMQLIADWEETGEK